MSRITASIVTILALLAACDRTTPTNNATATGPTPTCAFAQNQTSNDLRMNCTITGGLPNTLVDPANSGSSACSNTSFSLFNQSINSSVLVIYGENGDDNEARDRLGATINSSTHNGSLAKASGSGCGSITGPTVAVDTSFAGRHIALIDKGQTPVCVFESRLTLSPFNQTIGAGLATIPGLPGSPGLPIGPVTQSAVEAQVAQRLDLALATAANGLLKPTANTAEPGFVSRSGRCADGYQAFTGN